jgi:hypothetical protein
MSGPKRTPDKLNTIGIVVVGICSAVLVYVTIVALQAFYMGDTSEIQTMADYGGNDTTAKHIRATQTENIVKSSNPNAGAVGEQTYRVPISVGMKKVVDEAKVDPSNLVPVVGKSICRTVLPVFGRPKADDRPPLPECGGGAAPATPAPATDNKAPPQTPTGGTGPGGGPLPNQGSGTTGPGAGSATGPRTDRSNAAGSAEKGNGK